MNLKELRDRAKARYRRHVIQSDPLWNGYINDAYLEFFEAVWSTREATSTLAFAANDRFKALPLGVYSINWARKNGESITLQKLYRWADAAARFSLDVSGEPVAYLEWGGNLYLFPRPSSAYTAEIAYLGVPPILASDTDLPDLPETYHPALVDGALARAAGDDKDDSLASLHLARFEVRKKEARYVLSADYGPYPTPRDAFWEGLWPDAMIERR